MAACPPIDGDGVDSENFCSTLSVQVSKVFGNSSLPKSAPSGGNSKALPLDGEKAYDTVASLEESELRNLLEEVISPQSKNDKSAIAQFLIRKEEDALREESGSGEDTIELALVRQKKKRSACKRDHPVGSHLAASAAARNNTGGSLGSLHNLSDPKVPEPTNTNTQGIATRSRAGGSCGNLSKSSFETHAGKRRSRRSKEINRASTSQREGGSLQNLSKTEVACNEAKRLHKSGSLSQVFSEVGGTRIKIRRQKTSSESSARAQCRRSEDKEAVESSEEEPAEYPYQRLVPSSHSSVSGHSGEPAELSGMVGGHWNEDHMSDVASGETTEEDSEQMHISARAKLGDSGSRHHHLHHHSNHHNCDGSDTELHSVITHTSHRDILPTISSDSEVDKPISFNLTKSQEESVTSSGPTTTILSYSTPCVNSVFDGKSVPKVSDEEMDEKRKLQNTKSDGGSFDKISMDENGNPVLMSVRSNGGGGASTTSISSLQASCSDRHNKSLSIARSNNNNNNNANSQTTKDSIYTRLKAKQDKKKAIKERDVMLSEKTPGFRGDESLPAILKYLGADNDALASKSKRSKKVKKEEEGGVKTPGMGSRSSKADLLEEDEADFDKQKLDESGQSEPSSGSSCSASSSVSSTSSKKSEDGNGAEVEEVECHRGGPKKGAGGRLRGTSSVEELVSKSKQSAAEDERQGTVDDGDVSLSGFSTSSFPAYGGDLASPVGPGIKSEFSYDFYMVGDAQALLNEGSPAPAGPGDFEVVTRKKGKRGRNSVGGPGPRSSWANHAYHPLGSSSAPASNGGNQGYGLGVYHPNSSVVGDPGGGHGFKDQRRSFPPHRGNPGGPPGSFNGRQSGPERPTPINFNEGPFTVHDGAFLSQFGGSRDRYSAAATSVPHSEDSDSDGGDSVHSMPAHTTTPRPHVRRPPPSSGSTPQASYANIAKLAASANRAQMKRVAMANHSTLPTHSVEDAPLPFSGPTNPSVPPGEGSKESPTTNILEDDNFPPLTVGMTSPPGKVGGLDGPSSQEDPSPALKKEPARLPSSASPSSSVNESFAKSGSSSSKTPAEGGPSSGVNQSSFPGHPLVPPFPPPLSHTATPSATVAQPNVPHSQASSSHYPPPHQRMTSNHPPSFPAPVVPNGPPATSFHNSHPHHINRPISSTKPAPVPQVSNSQVVPQPSLSVNACNSVSVAKATPHDKVNKAPTTKEGKNGAASGSSRQPKSKDNVVENGGSRNKRYEAAVIFTDNSQFDLSITGIEFGFDMSLENLSTLSDKVSEPKSPNPATCNNNNNSHNNNNIKKNVINDKHQDVIKPSAVNTDNNRNIKNLQSTKQDYSKLYQPPETDVISYNYEELCKHVYKAWETTLRMYEEDPKNIQYWKAKGTPEKN